METAAVILTGGKNLRMGKNKALEIVAGKSLVQRVYDKLHLITDEVIVVTSREFPEIQLDGEYRIVTDVYPENGPLGGIYTGLMASLCETNIVVGCDMPFLNEPLLRYMVQHSEGYDAVVPLLDDGMKEPLHAVYLKKCAAVIEERLRTKRLGVHSFIDDLKVRYIQTEEIVRFDPELLTFFDINYPSDLIRAALIAGRIDID